MKANDRLERALGILIAGLALFCLANAVLVLATGNLVGIIPLIGAVLFGAVYWVAFQ